MIVTEPATAPGAVAARRRLTTTATKTTAGNALIATWLSSTLCRSRSNVEGDGSNAYTRPPAASRANTSAEKPAWAPTS